MRILGWVYLVLYFVDVVVSLTAAYIDSAAFELSTLLSTVVGVMSLAVLVLSLLGKVRPKGVFLPLSLYYFFMNLFGLGMGVVLGMRLGPQRIQQVELTPEFLQQQFAWYGAVQAILLGHQLLFAVYGLLKNRHGDEAIHDE